MPPLPVAPNVCKVTLSYLVGDKVCENVTHWIFAGGALATPAYVTAMSVAGADAAAAQAPIYGSTTVFETCSVIDLSSDTGAGDFNSVTTEGTRAGTPNSAMTAALFRYSVSRRYRGGHPRTYLPWGCATDLSGPQTWTSDFQTDAATAWQAIRDALLGVSTGGESTTAQCQVSYRTAGAPREVTQIDRINPLFIDPEVASQRRRDGRH